MPYKDLEKQKLYNKEYYLSNKEKCLKLYEQWRQNNPERVKFNNQATSYDRQGRYLKIKYRLTQQQFEAMYKEQNEVCAICNKPSNFIDKRTGKLKRLFIDHDHTTEEIRGLLCHNCNLMIGNAKDDIEILRKAIYYLEKHQIKGAA